LQGFWKYCIRRVERLHASGLWPPLGFKLLQQTPREDNSAADSLANRAIDIGAVRVSHMSGWNEFLKNLVSYPQSGIGVCAQFDGAARGNPQGPASWGVAVWWGHWRLHGFEACGLLEEHAKPIGVATNNVAEYLGCAFSLQLLVQRFSCLTEKIAKLART
jgi:hypothetical protein